MTEKKQLGKILLKQRAITPEELERELGEGGGRLASRLTEKGAITGVAALKALSEQHGIPGIDLEQVCVKLGDLELLPREIAQRHLILPVLSRGERLFVAMANPKEKKVIDELEFVTGKRVYPYVALEHALADTIEEAYSRKARGDEFYIGPRCPAETLQKLGIDAATAAQSRGNAPRRRSAPPPSLEPEEPALAEEPSPSPVTDGPLSLDLRSEPPRALDAGPALHLPTGAAAPLGLEISHFSERPPGAEAGVGNLVGSGVGSPFGAPAVQPGASDFSNDPFALADDTPLPPLRSKGPEEGPRSSRSPTGPGPTGVTILDPAAEQDISDEGFGDLNSELSVVTDIPDFGRGGALGERGDADKRAATATVLVVDDEAEIRRMLERLLTGRGYRVIQAETGNMALRLVKEHSPDLIVLDAMLPEIHGFDIARRIKGSKRYGHIPIVMVSAVYRGWHYAEDLRQSCGVEAFIEKPFKISDVIEAVERALAGREAKTEVDLEAMHQRAEDALRRGVDAYKEGRLDEAVQLLQEGVAIDPLAYRLHFHLGLLYGRKGQVFEGIAALERAVEINGRHFPAVKNLAVLYQKAGFRNKAAEMWHKAAVIAPDDATRESVKKQLMSLL